MVTIWKKLGSPVEILLFFYIKPSLKLTASKVSENCSGWKMKTFPFFGEFKPIFVGYVGFRERNPTENVPSPNLIFFAAETQQLEGFALLNRCELSVFGECTKAEK